MLNASSMRSVSATSFNRPVGVLASEQGVFVADTGNNRVVTFHLGHFRKDIHFYFFYFFYFFFF